MQYFRGWNSKFWPSVQLSTFHFLRYKLPFVFEVQKSIGLVLIIDVSVRSMTSHPWVPQSWRPRDLSPWEQRRRKDGWPRGPSHGVRCLHGDPTSHQGLRNRWAKHDKQDVQLVQCISTYLSLLGIGHLLTGCYFQPAFWPQQPSNWTCFRRFSFTSTPTWLSPAKFGGCSQLSSSSEISALTFFSTWSSRTSTAGCWRKGLSTVGQLISSSCFCSAYCQCCSSPCSSTSYYWVRFNFYLFDAISQVFS